MQQKSSHAGTRHSSTVSMRSVNANCDYGNRPRVATIWWGLHVNGNSISKLCCRSGQEGQDRAGQQGQGRTARSGQGRAGQQAKDAEEFMYRVHDNYMTMQASCIPWAFEMRWQYTQRLQPNVLAYTNNAQAKLEDLLDWSNTCA